MGISVDRSQGMSSCIHVRRRPVGARSHQKTRKPPVGTGADIPSRPFHGFRRRAGAEHRTPLLPGAERVSRSRPPRTPDRVYGTVGIQHLGKPDTRLRRGQRAQFNEFDPVTAIGVVPEIPQVTDSLKRGQLLSVASTRLFGRMSAQFASIHPRHSVLFARWPDRRPARGRLSKAGPVSADPRRSITR